MKVIKRNTGCYCSHCDQHEALYEISNEGGFKLFWANGQEDCEIAFCEDCAKELVMQLADALGVEVSTPAEKPSDATLATQCNNTEICYTYCDASNYKCHNRVVVEGNLTPAEIEQILVTRHEGEFFIPAQVGLPEERFIDYNEQDDHIWFILPDDAFSPTNRKPTTTITAAGLLANFRAVNGNWNELVAWDRLAGECIFGAEDENWHGDDMCESADVLREQNDEDGES